MGYKDSTLRTIGYALKHLSKHSNLKDPESVKAFIATKNLDSYKQKLLDAYELFCNFKGIQFIKPRLKRVHRLPFVPLENEIDTLIGGLPLRYAVFCQFLKDTGSRPIEAWNIRWIDIDSSNNIVRINNPAKGSNARIVKVTSQTIAMINRLPRRHEYVFRPNVNSKLENFCDRLRMYRDKIAEKLHNPRIKSITPRSLRHFKATMTYYKTKDILYVKEILGHVSIQNTLVYTHLVNFNENEWISKVAKTVEEAQKLIENGFEYVTTFDNIMIFRKRK